MCVNKMFVCYKIFKSLKLSIVRGFKMKRMFLDHFFPIYLEIFEKKRKIFFNAL